MVACFALMACNPKKIVKEVQYVDKPIPVYIVPEPAKVTRPKLHVDMLSNVDKNDPGRYAQALSASVIQLKGYIKELETVYNKYIELYEEGKQKLSTVLPEPAPSVYSWGVEDWKKYYNSLNFTTKEPNAAADSTK